MMFHINVPINITRMFSSFADWIYNHGPTFLQPVYKAVTVKSLIRDGIFTQQINWFQHQGILPVLR